MDLLIFNTVGYDFPRWNVIILDFNIGNPHNLTDQSLPLKIYHDSDIPYGQSDSIAE